MNKGQIISLPVTRVSKGMRVLWFNGGKQHILKVADKVWPYTYADDEVALSHAENIIAEFKTLAIEYYIQQGIKPFENNVKVNVPLKYSEWKRALSEGFIDSENEIDFELTKTYVEPPDSIHCNRGGDIEVGKIVYVWEDMRRLLQAYLTGVDDVNPEFILEKIKKNFNISKK